METTILIASWRFLLGVGIGGVYPLSAASEFEGHTGVEEEASESAEEGTTRRRRVAWAAFWQQVRVAGCAVSCMPPCLHCSSNVLDCVQPGQLLPYVVALLLMMGGGGGDKQLQYRVVLGLGTLFPVVVWADLASAERVFRVVKQFPFLIFSRENGTGGAPARGKADLMALPRVYWALLRDPAINRQLLGTMLCWFFFDVYAYGITLYTPEILEKIFGSSDTVSSDYWQNILSISVTLPASLASVFLLGKISSRSLQALGFAIASAGFLAIALSWRVLEKHSKIGLFVLFLVQKNTSVFGVATTSFVLPNELFKREIRGSCNGLAAATGKLGAFVGSYFFPYLYTDESMDAVFYACAVVALLGLATTLVLIPKQPAALAKSAKSTESETSFLLARDPA